MIWDDSVDKVVNEKYGRSSVGSPKAIHGSLDHKLDYSLHNAPAIRNLGNNPPSVAAMHLGYSLQSEHLLTFPGRYYPTFPTHISRVSRSP